MPENQQKYSCDRFNSSQKHWNNLPSGPSMLVASSSKEGWSLDKGWFSLNTQRTILISVFACFHKPFQALSIETVVFSIIESLSSFKSLACGYLLVLGSYLFNLQLGNPISIIVMISCSLKEVKIIILFISYIVVKEGRVKWIFDHERINRFY